MSLIGRRFRRTDGAALEQRSEWGSSSVPGPLDGGGGSYATPVPRSVDSALRMVAAWASIDLIASLVSSLPMQTYRRTTDDQATKLPNPKLVDDPGGDGHGAEDWIYQLMFSWLGTGNAVGRESSRDPTTGYPTQIVLYHPEDAYGWRDANGGEARWRINGREVPASSVWHRRVYPVPGCLMGMSPIEHHATTIGVGLAANRFGLQWFTDGAHPSSMLQNTEMEIDSTAATVAKSRYMSAVYGTREPLVMGKGWSHKAISVSPEESQFLDSQRFTSAQTARIYGPNVAEVLGYESGGSMTYANAEQRSSDLLVYTLDKWLVRVERMFTRMLPRPQFVRFTRGAFLRTTTLDRYKAHALALANQWKVVNEVRRDEDMGPVPWGDEPNAPTTQPALGDAKGA